MPILLEITIELATLFGLIAMIIYSAIWFFTTPDDVKLIRKWWAIPSVGLAVAATVAGIILLMALVLTFPVVTFCSIIVLSPLAAWVTQLVKQWYKKRLTNAQSNAKVLPTN